MMAEIKGAISTYPDAPILPVNAPSGEGLDARRSRQLDVRRSSIASYSCTHSFIDRVFSVDGHGTVVTGSLIQGEMSTGDPLCLTPNGQPIRCRSIQVHGEFCEHVAHGHRVAINLSGEKERPKVGQILTVPGAVAAGRVFDAEMRWLAHNRRPLRRKRALTLHLLGHRAQADVKADIEIRPGDSGTARIRLKRTLPLPPGAHFVLRGDPTHAFGSVVGGGRILDAHPKGRRSGEQRIRLASGTIDDARSLLIQEAGEMGMSDEELILRLPLPWVQSTRIHFMKIAAAAGVLMRRIRITALKPHRTGTG